jgi:hypothetical protein
MTLHAKSILGFVFRFAVIYGLLIVPWPGWNDLYGRYFESLGEMAFAREGGKGVVHFEPHPLQHGFTSLTSQMTVHNPDPDLPPGRIKAEMVGLDTRSIGWVPTALTLALILATPIPWTRRIRALLVGLILIHAFILFSLQACIWNKSADLSITTLTPFWKYVVDGLDYTLMTQLGASFSVPVIIWILVTFRRQDSF